jgi:hypothetical protein
VGIFLQAIVGLSLAIFDAQQYLMHHNIGAA